MKHWDRVLFAALVWLTTYVLWFFPVALAVWLGPYSITVFLLGALLTGWIGVLITREVVRSAKRTCSVTAVTAAHILHVAIVVSLVASTNTFMVDPRGLASKLIVIVGFPLEIASLLAATYWRSSPIVRAVVTGLALGVGCCFLFCEALVFGCSLMSCRISMTSSETRWQRSLFWLPLRLC